MFLENTFDLYASFMVTCEDLNSKFESSVYGTWGVLVSNIVWVFPMYPEFARKDNSAVQRSQRLRKVVHLLC